MSSGRFLTSCYEKNCIEGEIGGEGEVCPRLLVIVIIIIIIIIFSWTTLNTNCGPKAILSTP